MREPLLLPLAAIAAGISLSRLVDFSRNEALVSGALLLSLTALSARLHAPRLILTTCFCACISLGILTDLIHRPGPPPTVDAASDEIVTLDGCVVQPPILTPDREQFVLSLAPRANARVSLTLRPDDPVPALAYGDHVELDARLRRPRNFGNPGAFDYVRYLARQDVYWTATARSGTPIRVLDQRCGSRVQTAIFALRTAAIRRIEQLYAGDSYASSMMAAILVGDSSKLEKVWTDHFRRTGTYHALVISGLHITVLAGTLLFLLRLCILPEMYALTIAAIGAWLYAAISGWSAPVVRAAGGFTLYLIARYFYRRGRILNLLAALGIAYLLADPDELFDASFQLSFFSVAAIGAFAVPLLAATTGIYTHSVREINDLGRDPRMPPLAAAFRVELRLLAETVGFWLPVPERYTLTVLAALLRLAFYAFEMMVVSAVVQIALALPMALYFHRISITGLSANLFIVPTLAAVVPIGFAAIFTGFAPVAWLALQLLHFSEWIAKIHSGWEPSLRIPDPPFFLAAAFLAALILSGIALRLHSRFRWPCSLATLALFAVIIASPFAPEIEPGTLELTAVDVGQGDSLFLALPDGRTLLVDAGGIPSFGRSTKPRMDIGEDVVSPYLWTRHIRAIDIAVVTHLHEDHSGGIPAILENFHPRELWTGGTPDGPAWQALESRAAALGVPVRHLHAGDRSGAIEVLAPAADYLPGAAPRNNDSVALRVTHGEHTFLLMGDVEKNIEYRILADNALPPAIVLKVSHHGSKTSSTLDFLDATRPAFALISAGFENSFRHPHPEVIHRLAEHHTRVLRTDLDGLLTIRSNGHRLTVSHGAAGAQWNSDPYALPR